MDVKRPLQAIGLSILGLAILIQSGCGLLLHTVRMIHPTKVKALYSGLEGRRVAVVCEMATSSFGPYSPPDQIAKLVAHDLQERVDDVDVIPHDEIMNWKDTNDWNAIDYRQIGRGVNAEMVVAVDIKNYRIYEGTFYRGRADVTTRVFDMTQKGKPVHQSEVFDFKFPARGGIPSTEMSENNFRRQFIRALARHLSKAFYDYELREDLAIDSTYVGR